MLNTGRLRCSCRRTIRPRAELEKPFRSLRAATTWTGRHAAKARGRTLGNRSGAAHLRPYGNTEAVEVVRLELNERAERLRRVVSELRAAGITSANGLAKALNERHVATARGGTWTARSVLNVLERLGAG